MRPITLTRTLAAGAVGAVAAAQQTVGAANLLINGTLASGGVATLNPQQQVGITSTGNFAARTFTIYGTDTNGRVISEALVGPNNDTVNSVLNYVTITRIAVDGAVGTNVTVDTIQQGASQEIPMDVYQNPANISLQVEVTGAVTYTVEWTQDDVFNELGPYVWNAAQANLVGANSNQVGTLISAVTALRIRTTAGGGTVKFRIKQSGVMG